MPSVKKVWSVLMLVGMSFAMILPACGGRGAERAGGVVRVGEQAPSFTLPSAQSGGVSLSEFRGHKPVLLFFSMGPG